jgi:hypothetical protein
MLGRHCMALRVYRQLLSRGVKQIAHGDCGEGRGWARGLIADCFYRAAQRYKKLKERKAAIDGYRKHFCAVPDVGRSTQFAQLEKNYPN